jgi:PKD repeat protein
VVLAGLALSVTASSASGLIKQLARGRAASYVPLRGQAPLRSFDQLFTNLDYNGGRVMPSNTNYTVYWDPAGAPAYPADYRGGVDQYFSDLAHDSGSAGNVDSVSTQYNDRRGEFAAYRSSFGGALLDTDPYPVNGCKQATICLSDEQIVSELKSFIAARKLPVDLAHEYFLLTPPKVANCFVEGTHEECSAGSKKPVYCAYHANAPDAGAQLLYATDAYVTGNSSCDDGNHPNGLSSDGVIEGGLSHEHNESLTDPVPDDSWADLATGTSSGYEIGDKCRGVGAAEEFGTPLGEVFVEGKKAKYNQLINGRKYWYQQEWSNQGHTCLQRLVFAGAEPSATFASTPGAGDELKFNASESTAPGGVFRYSWQFGDGSAPLETTEAAVAHKFPGAGTYLVALTVFAQDGTSIGTARIVKTADEGPSAAFSLSAPISEAGQAGSFDASASHDPDGSITAYEWAFGDGSRATGLTTSHAYAARGTYIVTLVVTDSSGQTAAVSHAVEVDESPSVSFSLASSSPAAGEAVSFDGSASDPDGAITGYTWSFGDGSAATGNPASHTYAAAGAYPVTLSVTDSDGRSASATRTVTVGPAPTVEASPAAGSQATAPASVSATVLPAPLSPALTTRAVFGASAASINRVTGSITFSEALSERGTLSWLLTFPNGRFGTFAPSKSCPHVRSTRLRRCPPARIVFAKGRRSIASPGLQRLTLRPSKPALKALRRALTRGRALPVVATFTFLAAHGGRPVTRTLALKVKLARR